MTKTKKERKIILNDNQYCHIINKRNGKIALLEGPERRSLLNPFKELYGDIKKKIILKEEEYTIILNPFEVFGKIVAGKKKIMYGDRKIRFGPTNFSLHYGEELLLKGRIPILEQFQGLSLRAVKKFEDKDGITRNPGEAWIVRGPIRYVPHKYVDIVSKTEEISLAEHTGIYIKDTETGKIRLEKGVKTLMLTPYEELWEKQYSQSEMEAFKMEDYDIERTKAYPLWILENEVMKVMSEKGQKIVFGPKVILLEPHERPYVMTIAGGTPKNDKRLKIWRIKIGPNFSTDIVDVRTKDNAVLAIKLRYQWKFIIDENDYEKIFGTSDFIGLMTEMMASIIRDKAANYDFEELHSKASEIIKKAIFGDNEYYEFENGMKVFGIDIKEIVPKDEEIADKLNQAIKSNMEIYVNKMRQHAQIEAEKVKIDGEKDIEEKKIELIKVQHKNLKEIELIKSKIEAEKIGIKAEAEANVIMLKSKAESDAVALEIETLKETDKKYLELKRIESLNSIKKIAIIPTDSKIFLPIKELLLEEE